MAHPRQDEVRRRYHRRCGYCGVSETDTGGRADDEIIYRRVSAEVLTATTIWSTVVFAVTPTRAISGPRLPTCSRAAASFIRSLIRYLSIFLPERADRHVRAPDRNRSLSHLSASIESPAAIVTACTPAIRQLVSEAHQLLRSKNGEKRAVVSAVLLETFLRALHRRQEEESEPESDATRRMALKRNNGPLKS